MIYDKHGDFGDLDNVNFEGEHSRVLRSPKPPTLLAQLVSCLGLLSGFRRFDSRVWHILSQVTGERINTKNWLNA